MAIFKDKVKTKDGRSWFFQVLKKDLQGNSHLYKSKKYLTKKAAEEAQAVYLLKRDNPLHKNFHIVALAYFENLKTYAKYSTIHTYQNDYNKHIKPFYGNLDINGINTQVYNKWWLRMAEKKLKAKYLNKINSLLKNIFQFAIQNYGLEYNPVVKTFKEPNDKIIEDKNKIRYITKEEFYKFISVVDNDLWNTFFNLLFYTGVRVGEAIALTWDDIDFERKTIYINKTLYKIHNNLATSNKTNQNRQISISNNLLSILANYRQKMATYKDFQNNWYVFGNTVPLARTTIDRYKHRYFELSGVHEITIHEFRHSHVSMLINEYIKSGNTDTAKFFLMMSQRMGHTIPVMQKTYMHLFPSVQKDIVDLLNNL